MSRNDISSDGAADIIVTSPWGLGVLGLDGGSITERTQGANGTRFGDWLLDTAVNNVELRADMDGDGVGEVLMSSPWGIGLLKMVNGQLRSIAMGQNGQRFGGWIIDTVSNQFLHAGDVDGDGRDEILITSPWGIGFLRYTGAFTTLMLQPNGTRFGGWLLNTGDNSFPLMADVDGDGHAEVVVTSPWGLGVLKFANGTLDSIVMAPNGTSFGAWTLNTATDSIEVAADVDGDGRCELLVRGPAGVAVLRFDAGALRTIAVAAPGADLGGWHLDIAHDKLGVAADFDGDGRAELLVTGDTGIALVKLDAASGALRTAMTAPNGTRLGDWLLNTRDNRLNYAADFDHDGRAEVMISSPWGIGILKLTGSTFAPITMSPNGTRFGGWLLNTADNDLEAGLGQSYGLIVWHTDWTNAVTNTTAFLRKRGYTVTSLKDPDAWLVQLQRLALIIKPSDRVFVYLAGHGTSDRATSDTSKATALTHWFQFGDGDARLQGNYSDYAPWFKLMGAKGADVTVFDGSCDGGEAVMDAIGERYLALSTTGILVPGITDTPDPSHAMSEVGRPNSFGLWWSTEPTATAMFPDVPHRSYQKIYRSDDTDISYWSLLYKVAINWQLQVGGTWEMFTRGCYIYQFAWPDAYAALTADQKATLTVALDPYVAQMRAIRNDFQPAIDHLRTNLTNADVVSHAADVYAAAYPTPWRLLFGDPGWNVDTDPVHTSPGLWNAEPRTFAGRDGFMKMRDDILRILTVFEQSYEQQEAILRAMDRDVTRSQLVHLRLTEKLLVARPPRIIEYQLQNEHDLRMLPRTLAMLSHVDTPLVAISQSLDQVPLTAHLHPAAFHEIFGEQIKVIQKHVPIQVPDLPLADLVTQLTALLTLDSALLEQLYYELMIVEEAISRAQAKGVEVADLVSF
ncbi:MAG: FG-GAP-like repeat-containing protein [Cellulomonas sp.]